MNTPGVAAPGSLEHWHSIVDHWSEREPEAAFVAELRHLLATGDVQRLDEYLGHPLEFGTAGLRGPVGWGSGCMNEAMVTRVTWALGQFLRSRAESAVESSRLRVVVGFDARPDSARFASVCAEILSGLGLVVSLSEAPVPTPLVAYLVRALHAQAGVVVTASHNPRGDNGFKVYDDQGVQIISPWDSGIAQLMNEMPTLRALERHALYVESISREHEEAYLTQLQATAYATVPQLCDGKWRVAYTPLHGVGCSWVERSFKQSLPQVELCLVGEQAQPDGAFPTTPFPNPEESGTLDRLLRVAAEHDCDVALANDPDADRLAVCLREEKGGFFPISGDALGLLFADACLKSTSHPAPVLVSTIVSSPALDALAERRGAVVERTLTGFKWICRAALQAPQFVFAYEEALGYCFAPARGQTGVMDKDGLCAATVLGRMLAAAGSGAALLEQLLGLYAELGLFGSFGASLRLDRGPAPLAQMGQLLQHLRSQGPRLEADWSITHYEDFMLDAERRPSYLGQQDLLRFDLTRRAVGSFEPRAARVLVRPSGTEPKLKLYVHLQSDWDDGLGYSSQLARLQTYVAGLRDAFFKL
ncbi:MAG TPA: hypothetical protein VN764_10855 [Polyangiaceae bacterium]|nr:hypothetical protein [Polyangiaceae bacterium]